MTRREWALRVLDLPMAATEAQIREAYRDLVGVWHPDKHMANERVRARAEDMMKRLNQAREILLGDEYGGDWVGEGDMPPTAEPPPEGSAENKVRDSEPEDQNADFEPAEEEADRTRRKREPRGWLQKLQKLGAVVAWPVGLVAASCIVWVAFGPKAPIWIWEARFWNDWKRAVGGEEGKASAPVESHADALRQAQADDSSKEDLGSGPEAETPNLVGEWFIVLAHTYKNEQGAVKLASGVSWGGRDATVITTETMLGSGSSRPIPGLHAVVIGPFSEGTAKLGAEQMKGSFAGAFPHRLGTLPIRLQ